MRRPIQSTSFPCAMRILKNGKDKSMSDTRKKAEMVRKKMGKLVEKSFSIRGIRYYLRRYYE